MQTTRELAVARGLLAHNKPRRWNMSEDKMLAEIGISAEELDEAFRRLERHGFLKLELGSDGKIISFTRTEKPFCKVEWDDADPRVCQLATDLNDESTANA